MSDLFEKFRQGVQSVQPKIFSKLVMLLLSGGLFLAYFFLTGSHRHFTSTAPGNEEMCFVIQNGEHVIGSEKIVLKIEEGARTYYIDRHLPFNWFPEQIQSRVQLNQHHQVLAYERENFFHGIRDIATLEQMGSVNWQFFATNDVQEVTFIDNIVLCQDFCPLDENFIGLYQILVDKFDFSRPNLQQLFIFDGYGERRISAEFNSPELRMYFSETETTRIVLDSQRRIRQIYFPDGQFAERTGKLPELIVQSRTFSSLDYETIPIKFQSIDGTLLSGIFTLPKNRKVIPAVVLIGGTGPNSANQGGIFEEIADHLGRNGIASLRYDKRGILGSSGNYLSHTEDQLVDDAEGALNYLSEIPEIDDTRLGLLGYSEGAIISTALANRSPRVSACFLMAGPAVRIYPELTKIQIREQAKISGWSDQLVRRVISGIDATMHRLEADSSNWWNYGNRLGYVGWLRSLSHFDPQKLMTSFPYSIPVIIFQGEKDSVVPVAQAQKLVAYLTDKAHPRHELITFPGFGHLFGRRVTIPECLPYQEYVAVDSLFLETLGHKIRETLDYRPKADTYWVDFN